MNDSAYRVGTRGLLRTVAVSLAFFGLVAALATAQENDSGRDAGFFDETARLFGAQSKATALVDRLGGKIRYDLNRPGKIVTGVDLSGSKLTDADLIPLMDLLKSLPKLASLNLSKTGITDAGLAQLKVLPKLVSLDLSRTQVTDAGLAHLRRLTALWNLNVAQTRVTDAGVAGLHQERPTVRVARRPRSLTYFPDRLIETRRWGVFDDWLAHWFPADLYEIMGSSQWFPAGLVEPRDGSFLDDLFTNWYSEDLYAMKEPSLWSLSLSGREPTTYRILWEPSFDSPLAVRVVSSGEGAILHAVQLDGGSGERGGTPGLRRRVELTPDQWMELKRRVDDARFWSLPAVLWTDGVADGAGYVVEGVEGGTYHVVNANTNPCPDDRYRRYMALCESMVKLSGLDVMDLWREYEATSE